MKCSRCNVENPIDAAYCFNCGSKLIVENEIPVQEEQPVQEVVSEQEVSQPVMSEPVQEVQPVLSNQQSDKKKVNSGLIFLICVVALILILLGGMFLLKTPANVYKSVINRTTKLLSNTVTKYDTAIVDLSITPNINLSSNQQSVAGIINKFNLKYEGIMDNKNNAFDYKAIINYDNSELLNVRAVYKEKLYVTVKELFDKTIEAEVPTIDEIFKNNDKMEDTKYVYKAFMNALKSSLDNKYFSKEKETLNIAGKEVKTSVYNLNLDSNNIKAISKNVITKLEKDAKFIKSMASIQNVEEQEIKEMLKTSKESIESSESSLDESLIISIYTTGLTDKVVQVKLALENQETTVIVLGDNKYVLSTKIDDQEVSFEIEYSCEYNVGVDISTPTSTVNYNEMDTYDILGGLNKLTENKAYQELMNDYQKIMESLMGDYYSNYDYNYDYDSTTMSVIYND